MDEALVGTTEVNRSDELPVGTQTRTTCDGCGRTALCRIGLSYISLEWDVEVVALCESCWPNGWPN